MYLIFRGMAYVMISLAIFNVLALPFVTELIAEGVISVRATLTNSAKYAVLAIVLLVISDLIKRYD